MYPLTRSLSWLAIPLLSLPVHSHSLDDQLMESIAIRLRPVSHPPDSPVLRAASIVVMVATAGVFVAALAVFSTSRESVASFESSYLPDPLTDPSPSLTSYNEVE